MEAKLLAVFSSGVPLRVTASCCDLESSRQTLYEYRRRFEAEGPAGLAERSRRPHASPARVPAGTEEAIVRLRKELPSDRGAQTIAYHLARRGEPVPSVATIHRVLVRRGMVTPQPEKRPKVARKRFERPRPNDARRIDAACWALADGRTVRLADVLDDRSRALVAACVDTGPTARAAWEAGSAAAQDRGRPARVTSDDGPASRAGSPQRRSRRRADAPLARCAPPVLAARPPPDVRARQVRPAPQAGPARVMRAERPGASPFTKSGPEPEN